MYKSIIDEVHKLINKVSDYEKRKNQKLNRKTKKVLILTKQLEELAKTQGGKHE